MTVPGQFNLGLSTIIGRNIGLWKRVLIAPFAVSLRVLASTRQCGTGADGS